jgi:uncharacterized surface protein with fasciclin (FAS1) repeats
MKDYAVTHRYDVRHLMLSGLIMVSALAVVSDAQARHCMTPGAMSYGYQGFSPRPLQPSMIMPGYGAHWHAFHGHGKHGMSGVGAYHHPGHSEKRYDSEYSDRVKGTETDANSKDIVETAVSSGEFSTLIKAVKAASLEGLLKGDGPFTVFAPTDDAFNNLPEGTLDELLTDKQRLAVILKYHVIPGRLAAADIIQERELKTAQGSKLSASELSVVKADVKASNGVIHVIDNVLIPTL